jgi:hypothetical protein
MFCSFNVGNFDFLYFGHLFPHFSFVIFFIMCFGVFPSCLSYVAKCVLFKKVNKQKMTKIQINKVTIMK